MNECEGERDVAMEEEKERKREGNGVRGECVHQRVASEQSVACRKRENGKRSDGRFIVRSRAARGASGLSVNSPVSTLTSACWLKLREAFSNGEKATDAPTLGSSPGIFTVTLQAESEVLTTRSETKLSGSLRMLTGSLRSLGSAGIKYDWPLTTLPPVAGSGAPAQTAATSAPMSSTLANILQVQSRGCVCVCLGGLGECVCVCVWFG